MAPTQFKIEQDDRYTILSHNDVFLDLDSKERLDLSSRLLSQDKMDSKAFVIFPI